MPPIWRKQPAPRVDGRTTCAITHCPKARIAVWTPSFPVTVRKVVPIQCLFTFYGPDADEDAEKVWSRLFIDLGQGCPRSILRQAGMVPLPRPSHPNAAPELEGSLWRRRTDLTVYFSMLEEETIAVPQVEQPGGMDVRQK